MNQVRQLTLFLGRSTFVLFLLGMISTKASAETIRYTEFVVGSGTLDGKSFTGSLVTITGTADSGGVIYNSAVSTYSNDVGLGDVVITVSGMSTFDSFKDDIYVYDYQGTLTTSKAGFFSPSTGSGETILADTNAAFTSYALSAPIAPTLGTASGDVGPFATGSGGSFTLSSMSSGVSFQATAVPLASSAPACMALLGGLMLSKFPRKFAAM